MNMGLCVVFAGFGLVCAAAQDTESLRSKYLYDLRLQITQVSPDGKITVKISNVSKQPVRIWREGSSWGAGHWRVLRIRDSRVETFFEEADGNYTRNLPVSTAIPAGADVQKTLDPNGPDSEGMPWRGLAGRRVTFESGDTVVVVYDVPPTLEARGLGVLRGVSVWYGVTAAHTTVR